MLACSISHAISNALALTRKSWPVSHTMRLPRGSQGAGIKELRAMHPRAHISIATEAEANDYRKVTITGQLEDVYAAIGGILQKLLNK